MSIVAIDTSTYNYNIDVLKEFGIVAQAAILDDLSSFRDSKFLNSNESFKKTALWLHKCSDRLDLFTQCAEQAASTRTHPRHLMDASRMIGINVEGFGSQIETISGQLMSGVQFETSTEIRELATLALQVVEDDSKVTDAASLDAWAERLAKDCISKND